jgi:hypothetical protein
MNDVSIDLDYPSTNSGDYGVYFVSTATEINIDSLFIYDASVRCMQVAGAATSFTVTNSDISSDNADGGFNAFDFSSTLTGGYFEDLFIDLDVASSLGDGNRGFHIAGAVSNTSFINVTILAAEAYGMYFISTTNNVTIQDYTYDNYDGDGFCYGMRFLGDATDVTIDTATISMDYLGVGNSNDGQYGIDFTSMVNCTINKVTISDAENYGIYVSGTTSGLVSSNNIITNIDGSTTADGMAFIGAVSTASFTNDSISMQHTAGANNGDYSLRFSNATSNLTFTNCKYTYADLDGLQMQSALAHTATAFTNCLFDNNDRYGYSLSSSNAATALTLTNCTFSNTTGNDGLYISAGNGVRDITVTGCTFNDNNESGINITVADDIQITQCLFYGNGAKGIDLGSNGNLGYENPGDVPIINSSSKDGDDYTVVYTLPTICDGGDCSVEFFANDATDADNQARQYVTIQTLKNNSTHTVTITCTTG